jgi:hypothetical protein|tara:strand:+ start:43 stop:321 length:279 start_codon:yes stop_codon:yes gene_type:complete
MNSIKTMCFCLIALCSVNIALQFSILKEIEKEKPLPTLSIPALDKLIGDSKARESMIMQVILLGQHKGGLHEGESIDLCPACSVENLRITDL